MKEDNKDKHRYDDIINLGRHVSKHRKQMSVIDRAAQFSPFAALTGFEVAIKEASRLTDYRIELDEAEKSLLDEKIRIIKEQLGALQEVEFEFFKPDELKAGGSYVMVKGVVKKVDEYEHLVIMQDGTRIQIEEIVEINCDMFQSVDFGN